MLEAKVSDLESLYPQRIQEVIQSRGPCITMLLPPYRPGEPSHPIGAVVKSYLQQAERHLAETNISNAAQRDLLEPLIQIAGDPDLLAGSHWSRIIFRSAETFRQFTITGLVKPSFFVGGCFEIRPVLAELDMPDQFFVLILSKKQVEVLRCGGLHSEPVRLPAGVPATLAESMAFKPPDHDLENRSAAGHSTGSMPGVRFGTGSDRESRSTYLADFYKAIDRGIKEMLGPAAGCPLVLAGVDEDTALYRTVNRYVNLLARSVTGSFSDPLVDSDLISKARSIVREDRAERAVEALRDSRERLTPTRFSTNLSAILRAAANGRVARLYIDRAARMLGAFDGARRSGSWHWGEEDLLNVAAVETLLQGGSAFSVPTGRIPENAPLAAILRY
jgi:hypothetical protein